MKTKHWLYISMVCMIPLFFSTLLMSMIAFEKMLVGSSKFANIFLTGEFNVTFACWMFGLGALGVCVVFTTMLTLLRHAENVDKLEQAQYDLHVEKMKYRAATEKLAQL